MSRITNESEDGTLSRDLPDSPLIDEANFGGSTSEGVVLKKGPWTSTEDTILMDYVKKNGEGNWNAVQKNAGLLRCGKSCRLRWANHLRPNLKKGTFTTEEERLIIELHAKMGNRWAKMAAHLPGRTDNEIKNFWNTRIKRLQRSGSPLYPPDVCLQVFQENQQYQIACGIHSGDKGHHNLLQSSYDIPDVIFDSLKDNEGVSSYVPNILDISSSEMLMKGFGSSQLYNLVPPTIHRQKRLRESADPFSEYSGNFRHDTSPFDQTQDDSRENIVPRSFDLLFPYDTDPISKHLSPFGVNQSSHFILNGNFSASKPNRGPVKSELPSFQYSETDLGSWVSSPRPPLLESVDAFIQSPQPSEAPQSDCLSPRNSGLLDALLYEAKTLSSARNQVSDKSSSSSRVVTASDIANSSSLTMGSTEWKYYGDPVSPLGKSTASIFSDCTPMSATASSLEESPPAETIPGCNVNSDQVDQAWTLDGESKETCCQIDFSRPDAMLGSCWLEPSVSCAKDQGTMTDSIAMLLGDDLGGDDLGSDFGTTTSTLNQGWGFGSCSWNNIPAVYQMSQLR